MTLLTGPDRVQVYFAGQLIADSMAVITVQEGSYDPVYYLPREDVDLERCELSDLRTRCPYKGFARHWHIRVGDQYAENAAWSYEEVFEEALLLKQRFAFYPSRVDRIDITGNDPADKPD